MSSLLRHAKRELALIGYEPIESLPEEDPNRLIQENILALIKLLSEQGHSNVSAQYVISMFFKLASYEPLAPLTGDDSEWEKVDFQTYQNIRCSRVFKNINTGAIYDVQGKVFEEPDGARYTNNDSIVDITFPYMPKTEIVRIKAD